MKRRTKYSGRIVFLGPFFSGQKKLRYKEFIKYTLKKTGEICCGVIVEMIADGGDPIVRVRWGNGFVGTYYESHLILTPQLLENLP